MARPRNYQSDAALDRVQARFWSHGYDGTSMQDLEAATGLRKQTLYREFGNKDAMYARALDLYGDREITELAEVLMGGPDARMRFRDLFAAVLAPVAAGDRRGCFLCNAAVEHAISDTRTQQRTEAGMAATVDLFARALAVSTPYDSDDARAESRALALAAGYFGLRVMVRAGTPLATLQAVAESLIADI